MKVTISSSSNDLIDENYKKASAELTDFLASNDCDLNWGSGSSSIMGICYEQFLKHNRKMYGYTSSKYSDDIANLPQAKHTIFEDTLLLKKNIFTDADMVICLPGGTGTISEFFAYLEEIRSNDINKPLVLYNVDGHFDSTIALINDLIRRNFNSDSIFDYFTYVNNLTEFKQYFYDVMKEKENKIIK